VKPHLEPLPRFFTISHAERANVLQALTRPLSGYLGGIDSAGYFVEKLQDKWQEAFGVKHAIACNSATSGLLAACMAIGIKPGDSVWTSSYTMSATAACAKVLGADIAFIDIEPTRFSMNTNLFRAPYPKCIIVTNLLGHPAYLTRIRSWCDSNKVWMIEDNAQSPFATEGGKYAGTIGHIGAFSYNVHKSINSGEGGVIVTNDESLARKCSGAINHGELAGTIGAGLNLRMTELTAAVACAQLARAEKIIQSRIELAEQLTAMFDGVPWIKVHKPDIGCKSVYYAWVARVPKEVRIKLVIDFQFCGMPITAGYSKPLNHIFHSSQVCPMADRLQEELILFETCAYDPTRHQRKKMAEIVKYAIDKVDNGNQRQEDRARTSAVCSG
jgi:dTDP-4-amino-4,6-dideoxygalactose transaminase